MNLANKVFRNNKTGETIRVIDSFENIAILENKQKINVDQLMNTDNFTEQIDPNTFFNNQNAYNSLADKIKNIQTNEMSDEGGDVISINVDDNNNFQPSMNESAVIMTSEDDERAELARKYGVSNGGQDEDSIRQQEVFNRILNPDAEEVESYIPKTQQNLAQHVQRIEVEDPIITMFKKTKRNVNFNVNLEISDSIPRLDFIEMMEDSYEISIIDFLTEEFTNKIINDPSQIRDSIKSKIKQLVYGSQSTSMESKNNENLEKGLKDLEGKKYNTTKPRVTKQPRVTKTTPKTTSKVKNVEKIKVVE